MHTLWVVNNWKITVSSLGADSYEVTGDYPPSTNSRSPARVRTRFDRTAHYLENCAKLDAGDESAAREVGTHLFRFLFSGDDMSQAFKEWCAYAMRSAAVAAPEAGNVLRLILELPPNLANDPWEYMYSQEWTHLGRSRLFSIVRYVSPQLLNEERPPIPVSDVHVLALVSNPPPGSVNAPLDVGAELDALKRSWGDKEVPILDGNRCSLSELADHLDANSSAYHILHFIGHSGDGQILLQRDNRETPVSSEDFAVTLQPYRTLRLLVFTSCSASSSSTIEPLIHLQGVPAVVAMQYEMWDEPAAAFTEVLYQNGQHGLLKGDPIDLAVNGARRKLFQQFQGRRPYSNVWGCPTVTISSMTALDCFAIPLGTSMSGTFRIPGGGTETKTQRRVQVTRPLPVSVPSGEVITDFVTEGVEIGRAHQSPVSALAFVSNEPVLVSGSTDTTIKAWRCDATAPKIGEPASLLPGAWTGHIDEILCLVGVTDRSGSHAVLSAGRDLSLRLWNPLDGRCLREQRLTPSAVHVMTRHPTSKNSVLLLTEMGKLLYVRDVNDFLSKSPNDKGVDIGGEGRSVTMAEDGAWVATASLRSAARLWHYNAGMSPPLDGPLDLEHDSSESIQSVVAISTTRIVSAARSGKIYLWKVNDSPQRVQESVWPGQDVRWLVWLSSHNLLLTGSPGAIALWPVEEKIEAAPIWVRQPAGGAVTSIATYSDSSGAILAVGLSSGSIVLYYLHPLSMEAG